MNRAILFPLAALALTGCAPLPRPTDGVVHARLGQTVSVGGPRVTPLRVLADSRCPVNARCVWAGEVRIAARIASGRHSDTRELVLGQPVMVAGGRLELVEVRPAQHTDAAITPRKYRFGFRFAGGL